MSGECDECSEHAVDCKCILLKDLEISVRLENVLKRLGICSLNQLKEYSAQELLFKRNFGRNCLHEVRTLMAKNGMMLKDDVLLLRQEDIKKVMQMMDVINDFQEKMSQIIHELKRICLNLE